MIVDFPIANGEFHGSVHVLIEHHLSIGDMIPKTLRILDSGDVHNLQNGTFTKPTDLSQIFWG